MTAGKIHNEFTMRSQDTTGDGSDFFKLLVKEINKNLSAFSRSIRMDAE